ncbi:MAG: hypothetical protein J5I93_25100 [Pirellulaceae bacterium]|nr:hypothetical protein [Pirellulaceae bacterium]
MSKKGPYNGSCVFCGAVGEVTDDHVPPKSIFSRPRPSDLITVPGCAACNRGSSLDDEYFRTLLCLSDKTGEDPNAAAGREAAMRSMHRSEARGFTKMFLDGVFPTDVYSPGGVYLGKRMAFDVNVVRIQNVVAKTVRGLYYAASGRILPKSCDVSVFTNDILEQVNEVQLRNLHEQILAPLANTPEKVIGTGAFRYRFSIPESEECVSVWALTFFGAIPFLCITCPADCKL